MENLTKTHATVTGVPPSPASLRPGPDDSFVARAVHDDLVSMGMPRVNLLFIGRNRVTRGVLDRLLLDLREPLASWHSGEALIPPRPGRGGTLVLHELSGLTADEQSRLLEWLDRDAGRTQVVSTSTIALLPRVQSGTFIERLYYRLNTVCIDTGD
ncbi:MAG TPA: sigma 54-interacting transcriptional regulator [Vicinamibacterales bacterium]|nr:sigma 54-interacting transcriptional regulator [Vicinamibacterales bacterium]